MRYTEDWYAQSRLVDTIVRTQKGLPVRIHRCWGEDGTIFAQVTQLVSGREKTVPLDSLNVKPVSLGYINYKGRASYACRMPKRSDWRQGLRGQNATTLCGIRFTSIPDKHIAQTIKGRYPSLQDCLEEIDSVSSIAFSRRFAVVNDGSEGPKMLQYKGKKIVGSIIEDKPVLYDNFKWLQETLNQDWNT